MLDRFKNPVEFQQLNVFRGSVKDARLAIIKLAASQAASKPHPAKLLSRARDIVEELDALAPQLVETMGSQ